MHFKNNHDIFEYLKTNAHALKILLVEDDSLLRSEYVKFFGRIFDTVDEASDGFTGLEAALAKRYDLIITDIMMPNLSGLEMIEKIKAKYPNQSTLIVSAFHDETCLHKSVGLGIDGYIFKPLDMRLTLQMLSKVVSKILLYEENLLYKKHLEELVTIKSNEIIKTYTIDNVSGLFSLSKLQQDILVLKEHSLALLKIKNFKSINDFYGYDVGNNILLQTAFFFKKAIFKNPALYEAKLYRLSGAHFAIFAPLDGLKLESEINKIIKEFEITEITVKEQLIYLELYAGIVCRRDTITLSHADYALRLSEKNHKIVIYKNDEKSMQKHAMRLKCNNDIKRALLDGRFVPFYHPIVDNTTKKIAKYEALARMIMPDGEIIFPSCFLPVSRQTKTYNQITVAIIQKALEDFRDSECSVSVNISIDDIEDKPTRDFLLAQISLFPQPQRIIFELLESENIASYKEVRTFFALLKSYGCKIAIDDFGSGYSNFEHIAKLNIDYIKIDGSLISVLEQDPTSLAIVEMLGAFAQRMHIKTIAEYVSTDSLYALVNSLGLNESQGYIFGEPQPFNESMKHIQSV